MKILHTSDIHIDSPLTAKLSREKIKERRAELLGTLSRLGEAARTHRASAVIIAGDLFDSASVTKRAVRALLDTVRANSDIHFFILPGNHDAELLASAPCEAMDNLHIFEYGKATAFELDGVTFTGISPARADMFDALTLDVEKKNILVLHGDLVDGAAREYDSISARDAAGRGIDYIALGHYHSYSKKEIDSRADAVYSGTPEGRGFDECGKCGYVLIDTDTPRVSHRFIPFAKRTMRIVPLPLDDMTASSDIIDGARKALSGVPGEDLVRLELCGSYTPGLWKDTDAIMRSFGGQFYYFEVKDTSHISVNPEDYRYDRTLKGEFIRMVYADESLDEETKRAVVECGVFALMGED